MYNIITLQIFLWQINWKINKTYVKIKKKYTNHAQQNKIIWKPLTFFLLFLGNLTVSNVASFYRPRDAEEA